MANHYVDTAADAGGDGTTSDLTGEHCAWDTIADVNAASFDPDDSCLFKRGCTWRETLTVPDSGTAGHPITLGAYGTGDDPKILGSTQVSTWADEGSNHWSGTCALTPKQVFFVGTDDAIHWGDPKTYVDLSELVNEYDWCYNGTTLYVYAATNPDTRYTSVEASVRTSAILFQAQTYVTVQDIEAAYTKAATVKVGSNCVAQRLTVHHNDLANGPLEVGDGIQVFSVSSATVAYCDVSECGRHGIYVAAFSGTCSSNIVEHNIVHNCYHTGIDVMNVGGTMSGNITRYNLLYTDADYALPNISCVGIYYSGDSGASFPQVNGQIYYNTSYNMMTTHISVGADTTGTEVYNNACYGTNPLNTALYCAGINVNGARISGTIVKNNIAMDIYSGEGSGDCCLFIGDKTQISALDNNCWYQSAGGTRRYVRLHDGSYYNYHYNDQAAYQAATGFDTDGLWQNPEFVDADNHDFHLLSSSPCINAGMDVGLTEDFEGNPIR